MLNRKLDDLRHAEDEYNRAREILSDCAIVSPPLTKIVAGSCRAAGR